MECPKCNSDSHKNGFENGIQKYRCTNSACKFNFTDGAKDPVIKPKLGMNLKEFTDKYDKEHILNTTLAKVMRSLKKDVVYERQDVITMLALGNGFPGLSNALEAYTDQYGKASSKVFFSHPDTIDYLKRKAKLT